MKKMLTVKEAAAETGFSEHELKRGIREGDYPYIRIGAGRGKFYMDIDLLSEVLRNRQIANMAKKQESEQVIPFGIRRVAE